MAPLDSRYTQVGFYLIFIRVCNVCFVAELTIYMLWLEVLSIAAFEVAQPARRPKVFEPPLVDKFHHHHVLFEGLDGDEVHALLTAQVPGVQPAHTSTSETRIL